MKQKVHAAKIEEPFPERYRCPLQSAPVRSEVILRLCPVLKEVYRKIAQGAGK